MPPANGSGLPPPRAAGSSLPSTRPRPTKGHGCGRSPHTSRCCARSAESPVLETSASSTIWIRSAAVTNHITLRSSGLHMKLTVSMSMGGSPGGPCPRPSQSSC
eukprot:15718266-Heterocapsa_arctica.AAC.1